MEYSVPQFIDVEDKIIGPLTLKQFLIFLGFGIMEFFLWGIFGTGFIFFLISIPLLAVFAAIGFVKYNGRPLLSNAPSLLRFYTTPKQRIFKRTATVSLKVEKKDVNQREDIKTNLQEKKSQSRLRRLAYLLDQKSTEEDRLIHSGERKERWLNQI